MTHEQLSEYGLVIAESFTRLHNGLKPRKILVNKMKLCDYPVEFLEANALPEKEDNIF